MILSLSEAIWTDRVAAVISQEAAHGVEPIVRAEFAAISAALDRAPQ